MTVLAHIFREFVFASCVLLDKFLPARGVPILLYHSIDGSGSPSSVSPANFARQMKYLHGRGWATLSLDELLACIRRGRLPEKRLVISFDDGYHNVLTEALPVLESLGFTATLFLATAYVAGRNTYAKHKMPELPMLTWDEVRTLMSRGWQVESHGHTHSDLPQLDRARVRWELQSSRDEISANAGTTPKHFSYPRGKYSPDIVDVVRETGYQSAVSTRSGLVRNTSNPWLLERLWVADTSLLHFRALLTEPYSWIATLRRTLARRMIR